MSVSPSSAAEGTSGFTDATVTISLSPGRAGNTAFNVCLSGTATRGTDYQATQTSNAIILGIGSDGCFQVSFSPNQTSSQFKIRVIGDTAQESNETVIVTLQRRSNTHSSVGISTTNGSATYTIINNDDTNTINHTASISVSPSSAAEGNSGSSYATVTVSLSAADTSAITVPLCVSGTATRGTDYTLVSRNNNNALSLVTLSLDGGQSCTGQFVLFNAGVTSRQYRIRVFGDTTPEPDKTVILRLRRAAGTPADVAISTTRGSATYTIQDDDQINHEASITVFPTWRAEGNNNVLNSYYVDLRLSSADTRSLDFDICLSGTATRQTGAAKASGDDYVFSGDWSITPRPFALTNKGSGCALGTTVTFAAGETRKRVYLYTFGDTTDERDETVVMTLRKSSSNTVADAGVSATRGKATHTIVDDDAEANHVASISLSQARAVEGDSGSRYYDVTVNLSAADTRILDFDICLSGTATEGQANDYYLAELGSLRTNPFSLGGCTGAVVRFQLGQTRKTWRLYVNGDTDDEAHETVVMTLRSHSGNPLDAAVAPGGDKATFTIENDEVSTGPVPQCNTVGTPCLFLSDRNGKRVNYRTTEKAGGGFEFMVSQYPIHRTRATHYRLCFRGSATLGVDYHVSRFYSGSLPLEAATANCMDAGISPGDDRATYFVKFRDDKVEEGNETVIVELSHDPDNSAQGRRLYYRNGKPPSLTYTIVDDDAPPPSQGEPDVAGLGDGAPAVVVDPDDLPPTTTDDPVGALVVTSKDDTSLSLAWPKVRWADGYSVRYWEEAAPQLKIGQSTPVNTITLGHLKPETKYVVRVSFVLDGKLHWDKTSPKLFVTTEAAPADDDEAPALPVASFAAAASSAEEDAGTANVTVNLSPAPKAAMTLAYTVGGTATAGKTGDFTIAGSGSVSVVAGATSATIPVAIRDDGDDESAETVILTLTDGAAYDLGATKAHTLTIADNDDAPALPVASFAAASSSAEEDAGTANVTVNLAPAPKAAMTLAYTVGGTATAGATGDFTIAGSGSVSVVAGATSATIPVAIRDDGDDESAETVILTLTDGTAYDLGATKAHTLTIADNDDAPGVPVVTVLSREAVTEGAQALFAVVVTPVQAKDLAVKVTVGQTGDYAKSGALGAHTAVIPAGAQAVVFTVETQADTTDEADGAVTVTVAAGDGYSVGAPASASVTVRDDDTTAVVSFAAAASNADEDAGTVNVTVNLAPAPSADIVLTYTVSGTATAGKSGDFTIAGSGQVSVAAGATSATIPVAIRDDGDDESAETVILTLADGAVYDLGATTAHTLTIADDDEPAVQDPSAPNLPATSTAEPVGRLVLTGATETGLTVAWPPVTGAEGYEVRWWKRAASRDKSRQRVAANAYALTGLEPGTEYVVRAFFVLDGVVRNDKASPPLRVWTRGTGPRIDVADASVDEAPGARLAFRVSLGTAATKPVTVAYATRDRSAKAGADYTATGGTLAFAKGDTEKTVYVPVIDDAHDEGRETLELVLSDARGAPLARAVATGTIVNTDPMPAAWLARLGRTVAEQALDAVSGRIAADRGAGMSGQVAGQALPDVAFSGGGAAGDAADAAAGRDAALAMAEVARRFGDGSRSGAGWNGPAHDPHDPFGHDRRGLAESRTMTARDALLGSSFSLTGGTDGRGGTLAFWGRAAQASFDGEDGTLSLDGEVTTGLLGTDYAAGRWLFGLALATSSGEGGYRDSAGDGDGGDDARTAMSGKIETSLAAAVPYLALRASDRLRLWGAAGYGAGEMTLKPEGAPAMKADIGWTMAAAGARASLLAPAGEGPGSGSGTGPALDLVSDALWTRTTSEKAADLGATEGDATRLRLGLEGSWQVALEGGGSVVPRLSAGARHDGGDAETGFGVELGGGIAWTDPALGLQLDLEGRTLLAHEADGLKDRGFSAGLAFDPDPASERGPSLTLRQDWGAQANGGLDALFAPDPLEDRAGAEEKSRWTVEGAWGFPVFANRFTGSPHVGVGLATGSRDYTVGWRLAPAARPDAPDFDLGVTATRRESDAAEPEHRVGFEIRATW